MTAALAGADPLPVNGTAGWAQSWRGVMIVVGDVGEVLGHSPAAFDAVVLDVDNGPHDLALAGDRRLYGPAGLARLRRALRPGGVLALWSADPAPEVVTKLVGAGLRAWSETVQPIPGDGRLQHTIVLAVSTEETSNPRRRGEP